MPPKMGFSPAVRCAEVDALLVCGAGKPVAAFFFFCSFTKASITTAPTIAAVTTAPPISHFFKLDLAGATAPGLAGSGGIAAVGAVAAGGVDGAGPGAGVRVRVQGLASRRAAR